MVPETIVISLGGSVMVPGEIDIGFVKEFKELILSQVSHGKKFIIITGGGYICRKYQNALQGTASPSNDELDWLGIHSTRLNAQFVRLLFGDKAESEIITDPNLPVKFEKPIVVGGGWRPGFSTDHDVVMLAKQVGAKRAINLTNATYVYEADPRINPNAKKIEKISWEDYLKIIPQEWTPGMNTPFDPIASRLAMEAKLPVIIMNGRPILNFANCLNNEPFLGTVIS